MYSTSYSAITAVAKQLFSKADGNFFDVYGVQFTFVCYKLVVCDYRKKLN